MRSASPRGGFWLSGQHRENVLRLRKRDDQHLTRRYRHHAAVRRAPRGQQTRDEIHALSRRDRPLLNLECVGAAGHDRAGRPHRRDPAEARAAAERRTANRSAWSSDSFRNTIVAGPESGVAPPECRPPHAVTAARTTPLTSVLRYAFHICTSDDCPCGRPQSREESAAISCPVCRRRADSGEPRLRNCLTTTYQAADG